MTGNPPNTELAPSIRETLDALRRQIRRYVWLRGLGAAAAWLCAAFWITLAVDWFFEPAWQGRVALLVAAIFALIALVWAMLVRRLSVPIGDGNLAMILERRFPQFGDSLLTAVELSGADQDAEDCDPHLLAATCRQAEIPVRQSPLSRVFNPGPLRQSVGAGAVLLTSIVVFAVAAPDLAATWTRRVVLLSDELWPRNSRIVLEGFDQGVAKVARGADLEIVAKADLSMPVVPELVEIRYRGMGGLRKVMNRVGNADPDRDEFQEYSYIFRGVLAPIVFDLVGGDSSLRGLKIDVVENPAIVEMILDCEFPKYTERPPRSLPVTGLMQLPMGTRITVRARCNKPLVRVTAELAQGDPPKPPQVISPLGEDPRRFTYVIEKLMDDRTVLFTLADADGVKTREPMRLTLAALEDRRPELAVQLRGIGSAITPQASIPAAGRVDDDYGIAKIWFEHAVDKQEPKNEAIAVPPAAATHYDLTRTLDVRPLGLKPGQKFAFAVKAEDRFDLTGRPNAGTSDRWVVDVVTPEQLRTMLQSRELVLRQRFESLIKDVTDIRDSLARVDFKPHSNLPAAKPPTPSKGAEPGDKPDAPAQPSPERAAAQRLLQIQWSQQNSRKSAYETAGLAEAFLQIREELINNRVDTEELKLRLDDGIAKPLQRVAGQMFPELDRRLDRLQLVAPDPVQGGEGLQAALQQVDGILLVMRQVLGRMIELEDYNEAVELLKSILQAEQKLHDQTKRLHKDKLRDLLEK